MKCVCLVPPALAAASALLLSMCEYPYSPQTQPAPNVTAAPSESRLRPVNTGIQICNESISQDPVNFPGCMLWLNFNGNLAVNVPAKWLSDYTVRDVAMHDRLTITDTSNTVKWFVKKPAEIQGELQDPEWAAHPDYIATMGKDNQRNFDFFVVRISDKSWLKVNEDGLDGTSTPHLWLPRSHSATGTLPSNPTFDSKTGLIDKASLVEYFGTDTVKIMYSKRIGSYLQVHYADYSADVPVLTALKKPVGKEDWECESALFSPDGKWVSFNAFSGNDYAAYIQELSPTSEPILVAEPGSDPRWYQDPADGSFYIVYSTLGGLITEELIEGGNDDGSLGSTMIRKADLPAVGESVPAWYVFKNPPVKLLDLPFKGGLSPDGKFLCTGYRYAYLYVLN